LVTIEIESAKSDGPDSDGEAEDRPNTRFDHRSGEGEPPGNDGLSEIGLQHRPLTVVSVHARALSKGELEVLDKGAHTVSGAKRAPRRVI
jgi:hypothetical protein